VVFDSCRCTVLREGLSKIGMIAARKKQDKVSQPQAKHQDFMGGASLRFDGVVIYADSHSG
jgi:hypothetical protein